MAPKTLEALYKPNPRVRFAMRLLSYHGGGGSRVYALGSHLVGDHAIPYDMIRHARNELLADANKPHRPGYGSKWLSVALRLLAARLTRWMQTDTPPWSTPAHTRPEGTRRYKCMADPQIRTLIEKEN